MVIHTLTLNFPRSVDCQNFSLVAIGEAPDAESITKALLSWGSKGPLRTETLTGFTAEKMIELVKGAGI